jgi:antitoxin component HigA of HigAB toxin-antitoxin module
MRQQCPYGGCHAFEHMTSVQQDEPHVAALDDVATVHHDDLERTLPDSQRSELEAMHDSPGDPNEDDDSDPLPNCQA